MIQLTEKQIDFIINDIEKRGIEIKDLQQNLLDHICCIIELEMKSNNDFEIIYNQVITRFYKTDLQEIEQETINLLTYKNYYFMKKVLILSGIAATTSIVIGSALKLFHLPGAAFFYMIAALVSSFLFLPLLFILKNKELKQVQEKLVLASAIITGMLYSVAVCGVFLNFEIAHKGILWLIYIGFASFIFVPLYFFNGIKNPVMKMNTIIVTMLFVIFISSQFLLVDLRPLFCDVWFINK
jgi:hypothetical protein